MRRPLNPREEKVHHFIGGARLEPTKIFPIRPLF